MALLQASPPAPVPHPSWLTAFSAPCSMQRSSCLVRTLLFISVLPIALGTVSGKQRMCDLISVLGKVTLSRCTYVLWPQMIPKSDTCHCCLMLGLPWFPSASRLFSSLGLSLWPPHHAGWGPLHEGPILSFPTGLFLDTDCPAAGPGKCSEPCTH